MKYSIIMPCLYRKKDHKPIVEECLAKIKEHSTDYELIIIDDGSPLDTTFLRKEADIYIRHKKPMGIAYGWNHGLKLARGKYLAVVNDDIFPVGGWLEAMVKGFETFPKALVSAPHVEHLPNDRELLEKKEWFPGMCFMLTQKTIKKIGYFDEQFTPFNYEDVDYWVRVLKSGGTLAQNHTLTVGHKMGHVIHYIDDNQNVDQTNKKKFIKKWGFDPIPSMYHGQELP